MLNANLQFLDLSDNFLYDEPHSIFPAVTPKIHSVYLDSPISTINAKGMSGNGKQTSKLTGVLPKNMGFALPNLRSLSLQRHLLETIPDSLVNSIAVLTLRLTHRLASSGWKITCSPGHHLWSCNLTMDEFYCGGNDFECGMMPCFHCSYCSSGDDQLLPCSKSCRPCLDPANCPGGSLAACIALCRPILRCLQSVSKIAGGDVADCMLKR